MASPQFHTRNIVEILLFNLAGYLVRRYRDTATRNHKAEKNELIQSDIAAYDFPKGANGVLATGLFGYIPEYDRVIKAASQSLVPGGHLSILDSSQHTRPENQKHQVPP